MNKTFSISEALSFGWNQFKSHWKFWLVAYLIVFAASFSGYNYNSSTSSKNQNSGSNISSITKSISKLERDVLGEKTEAVNTNTTNTIDTDTEKKPSYIPTALLLLLIPYVLVAGLGFIFVLILSVLIGIIFQMGLVHLTVGVARGGNLDYKTILSDVSVKKSLRFLFAIFLVALVTGLGLLIFIIPGIYLAYRLMFVPYLVVDKNLGIGDSFKESANLSKGVKLKLFAFTLVSLFLMLIGLIVFIVGILPAFMVLNLSVAYIYVTLDKQNSVPTVLIENNS